MDDLFAVWIFHVILCVATAVVLIIGSIRFKSLMHLAIIQRRYPRIVMLECITAIIVMLVFSPLFLLETLEFPALRDYQNILHHTMWSFYPLCHLIVYCEACRLWLVSYDLHLLRWSQKNSWKLQINSKFGGKNWWLKHKQTLGSSRYITPRILGWAIISGLISSALFQKYGNTDIPAAIADTLLYGFPVNFVLFIYYKSPKLANDRFLFLTEFKYTAAIYFISLNVYTIGLFLNFFAKKSGQITIAVGASWVGFSWVSILSTLWIPRQVALKKEWRRSIGIGNLSVGRAISVGDGGVPADPNERQPLHQCFVEERQFAKFVSYLNREFALENMLAFIEFVQFKLYFKQIYSGESDETVEMQGMRVAFNFGDQDLQSEIVYQTVDFGNNKKEIPRATGLSTVTSQSRSTDSVYDKANEAAVVASLTGSYGTHLSQRLSEVHAVSKSDEHGSSTPSNEPNEEPDAAEKMRILLAFKKIAHLLYDRYIREQSELEVNISGRERMRLNRLMQNESQWLDNDRITADQLPCLFDSVCMELYQLMSHTFYRFKASHDQSV